MFPLKVFRLFEQAKEIPHASIQHRRPTSNQTQTGNGGEDLSWPEVERRQDQDRRHTDRRAKQQAILLNTRKLQGRRQNSGRRLEDQMASQNSRINISIKG
ncbi:hypothetical protein [Undibacterium sp. TS12]|uniref:hypothetical protein n=1 Tax=Undibacterium sp. TS12 TaxID=2908202 RepID=UPI001F4CEAC0|nr:hypothetical protein [Undibacterium sp. TS12]MCH8617745.1 hypothetical protein [Undibacterium sp. TS12]